ncbi:hypothetical protein JCM10212_007151 [Sporobolomyces blumeae]
MSELASTTAATLDPAQLAPPGPALDPLPGPIPSFQDLTDSSGQEDDDADWEAIIKAAEEAFTEEQIIDMTTFLKERGLFAFVNEYVHDRNVPIRTLLLAFGVMIPLETPYNDQLRMLKVACSRVLRNRERLEEYQTIDDAVASIRRSKRILVLTGAGVSTSCGIPDFRSPTGLYARLKAEGNWDLDDPQDMFDLSYFKERPDVFYGFAKEIYPSNFVPSPCHRFVRLLEMNEKLLRNYTQNIDGLFEQVGCERMMNCHGSFATASCLTCRRRYPGSFIEPDVFASRVPLCPPCTEEQELERLARIEERERAKRVEGPPPKKKAKKVNEWEEESDGDGLDGEGSGGDAGVWGYGTGWKGKALIKPDIVFFGENLSDEFDRKLLSDRDEVDLLIVMGTSLRVSPVAQLPSHLPHSVPQILINRDPVSHHNFDICLLGDGDTIVKYLCDKLQQAVDAPSGIERQANGEERKVPKGEWDLEERVPVQAKGKARAEVLDRDRVTSPSASLPPPLASVATDPSAPIAPTASGASIEPERVSTSHVWLFPGANPDSRWVNLVREAFDEHPPSDDDNDNDDDEEPEDGIVVARGREYEEGKVGTTDGLVDVPASLAPGVIEGEGSDGDEDEADENESDDGTQVKSVERSS